MITEIKNPAPLNRNDVIKTYNGVATGCACGCSGDYAYPERGAAVTRRVNTINKHLDTAEVYSEFGMVFYQVVWGGRVFSAVISEASYRKAEREQYRNALIAEGATEQQAEFLTILSH